MTGILVGILGLEFVMMETCLFTLMGYCFYLDIMVALLAVNRNTSCICTSYLYEFQWSLFHSVNASNKVRL